MWDSSNRELIKRCFVKLTWHYLSNLKMMTQQHEGVISGFLWFDVTVCYSVKVLWVTIRWKSVIEVQTIYHWLRTVFTPCPNTKKDSYLCCDLRTVLIQLYPGGWRDWKRDQEVKICTWGTCDVSVMLLHGSLSTSLCRHSASVLLCDTAFVIKKLKLH